MYLHSIVHVPETGTVRLTYGIIFCYWTFDVAVPQSDGVVSTISLCHMGLWVLKYIEIHYSYFISVKVIG